MEPIQTRVLGIQLPTDSPWVNMAEMSLEEILTKHISAQKKC